MALLLVYRGYTLHVYRQLRKWHVEFVGICGEDACDANEALCALADEMDLDVPEYNAILRREGVGGMLARFRELIHPPKKKGA